MGRSPCCDKNGLKKGPWTPEEDMKLIQYIQIHGPGNWRTLPKNAGLQRCGKSCRLRWTNYLRPDIKRGRFTFEEEETIIQLHSVLGNKWSAIAARLPGRTDNEIKNYWNTHIRKRLLRMGIDPVTHAPRLDLLDLSSLLNSPQLNLSNLIKLQTLLNPEALRLFTTLLATNNNENPEFLLQKLQDQNQLLNAHQLLQNQAHLFQQNNHEFDNSSDNVLDQQQIPPCSTSDFSSPSFPNQTNFTPQFPINPTSLNDHMFQNNFCYDQASDHHLFVTAPTTTMTTGVSDNSSFQSLNNNSTNSNNSQNFSFDNSVNLSTATPLSSPTPLNSTSTYFNGSTEDERDSYCSELLKFEIPESLDFDDFM